MPTNDATIIVKQQSTPQLLLVQHPNNHSPLIGRRRRRYVVCLLYVVGVTDAGDTSATTVADDHASKQTINPSLLLAQQPQIYILLAINSVTPTMTRCLFAVVDARRHVGCPSPQRLILAITACDADDEQNNNQPTPATYYSPNHCWFPFLICHSAKQHATNVA
jgi:hypothetical protein